MKGLFFNNYDYYEWHNLVCVSNSEEALINYHKGRKEPLLSGEEQLAAKDKEERHYVIEDIECIS